MHMQSENDAGCKIDADENQLFTLIHVLAVQGLCHRDHMLVKEIIYICRFVPFTCIQIVLLMTRRYPNFEIINIHSVVALRCP